MKMESTSMNTLKWGFLALIALCAPTVWFVTQSLPEPELAEAVSWMYFYEFEPIFKTNFTFLLRESVKCKDTTPFLVILVTSKPKETLARQAIRVSWGSVTMWQGRPVRTLFLLGKDTTEENGKESPKLKEENDRYGDIICQDFLDTYYNLTLKTIMGFRWFSEFCPNAKYVMKADSDVFINIGNVVNFLLQVNSSDTLFTGYPFMDNKSFRARYHHKHYISYQDYPFKFYPPYCSGLGYVLSGNLATKIYDIMSHVKPFRFEDAYVGVCLKILDINIYIPKKDLFYISKVKFDTCTYKKLCAVHGLSPDELVMYWWAIQKPAECLSESQK